MLHIGDTRKALINGIKTVVIRGITGSYITVSLGFDSQGNDITTVISKYDILPKQ